MPEKASSSKFPQEPARRLASVDEGAKYLAVSNKTVWRYIADGRIAGYRVGSRLVRVDLNELDNLLQRIPASGGDVA